MVGERQLFQAGDQGAQLHGAQFDAVQGDSGGDLHQHIAQTGLAGTHTGVARPHGGAPGTECIKHPLGIQTRLRLVAGASVAPDLQMFQPAMRSGR